MKLPQPIELAIREIESSLALRGGQQAGYPRLRRLRSAIEEECRSSSVSNDSQIRDAVVLHLDMLMVDRLRSWARNIQSGGGGNITMWGQPQFVAQTMCQMADDLEYVIKSVKVDIDVALGNE